MKLFQKFLTLAQKYLFYKRKGTKNKEQRTKQTGPAGPKVRRGEKIGAVAAERAEGEGAATTAAAIGSAGSAREEGSAVQSIKPTTAGRQGIGATTAGR